MGSYYLDSFIGVKDGTKVPADRADGRKVGAKLSSIIASKPAGVTYANGDLIFLGTLRAGESLRDIRCNTGASLSTTTLTIGTIDDPDKYANAKTLTTANVPTSLGPLAAAADDAPLTADEDIWCTLGVGGIADNPLTFELVVASVK